MGAALVIHPGALGDVLLAVPALRALRASGSSATLAAQPRIGALLAVLHVVDAAVPFETLGLDTLFTDAPLAADTPLARHLARATRVVCWFGARDRDFVRRFETLAPAVTIAPATPAPPATPPTGPSSGPTPGSPTAPPAPAHPSDRDAANASIALVWRHLLDTVGGAADRAPIEVPAAQRDDGREALRAAGWDGRSRLLVIHPGAGGTAKRWPAEGFAEVADGVDATVVVHEGPADADAVRRFLAHVRRPALHLANPSLPTLAGVLSLATAYLGNDSGVSHLAATVGAPSVVLFTEAALPWLPWSATASCLPVTTSTLQETDRTTVMKALSALI